LDCNNLLTGDVIVNISETVINVKINSPDDADLDKEDALLAVFISS